MLEIRMEQEQEVQKINGRDPLNTLIELIYIYCVLMQFYSVIVLFLRRFLIQYSIPILSFILKF